MMHRFRVLFVLSLVAMLFGSFGYQPTQARTPDPTPKQHPGILGTLPNTERVQVIVHFATPPLALYRGGVTGLKPTNPSLLGQARLDINSSASQAYLRHLATMHTAFKQEVAQVIVKPEVLADYRVTFNGMALDVPTDQVDALLKLSDVRLVEVNEIVQPHTDSTPEFLGAPAFWSELGAADGSTAGEGIVVGVIDTGIYNPSTALTTTGIHPSLTDPAPVGGEYDSSFTYKGVCAPTDPQPQDGSFGECNDKLIGAWWYNAGDADNPGEMMSPMDEDGHGTHTATTAAGNGGVMTPYGVASGIAPRARLIAYKVCWSEDPENPDDGGCANVDSVSAIEQAIIDGVDVINFSIGGGNNPWQSSVELAFLGAFEAGVIVNTSAGNDGVDTVEHESPWLMTVAASTQPRTFYGILELGGIDAPGPFYGAGSSPGTMTGTLVLAPAQSANDATPSLCLQPYAEGTFQATDIVVCRRGGTFYINKYANVFAGGANAVIVGNAADSPAGEPPTVDCARVCVNFDYNTTEAIVEYITGTLVPTGTLRGGVPTLGDAGDHLASFSSTGPADTLNMLKPDIAAVGVEVNAGITAFIWDNAFDDGQLYGLKNGTSMASPHVAGASALMRQLHPDWSPAEVKSALQTTAHQDLFNPATGATATPFEQGSGRLQLSNAVSAGLTLDETAARFLTADPSIGGDPRTLNIPSLINETCIDACTWTRTVRNALDTSSSWTASSVVTSGLNITVEPANFTLAAGATQTITITADVSASPTDEWIFGKLILTEDGAQAPAAHMPVAIVSTLGEVPEIVDIVTTQPTGSVDVPDIITASTNDLTVQEYGLVKGTEVYTSSLVEDQTNGDFLDNLEDMLVVETTVTTGTARLVVEVLSTTSPDLDLFVLVDVNNNGIPESNELAYYSASAATLEKVDVLEPYVGNYFIIVQNYAASASGSDAVRLAYAAVPSESAGNMTVTAPTSSSPDQPVDFQVNWNIPTLQGGDAWYGAFTVGTSGANPDNVGMVRVDLRALSQVYLPIVRR